MAKERITRGMIERMTKTLAGEMGVPYAGDCEKGRPYPPNTLAVDFYKYGGGYKLMTYEGHGESSAFSMPRCDAKTFFWALQFAIEALKKKETIEKESVKK